MCDLYDHIAGQGGWFDKDGNLVTDFANHKGCLYSDELKDFEAFKKATGGVLYQHHKVKVDEYNQQFVKEHCKEFDFALKLETVSDKRSKTGQREISNYEYTYWGKKYTLNELNKHGVYITVEIYFDTLLDLIPYYPYVVSMSCNNNGQQVVYIANQSHVDEEFETRLKYGHISYINYKKELQKHYLEVCNKYFLKDLDKRTVIEIVDKNNIVKSGEDYLFKPSKSIDYMHDIEWEFEGSTKTHWCSPKFFDENVIELNHQDVEYFLKNEIENGIAKIKYVSKCDFDLDLN